MAKFTDSDSEDDQVVLSSKFKNLKFDAPVVSVGDQSQAQSDAEHTDRLVIKKRRLVQNNQVQKATNSVVPVNFMMQLLN